MQPDASRRQARSFRHAASPLLDEDFESCTPLPVSPDRSAAHLPAPCSPRASPYGPSRATPIAPRRGARLRRRTRRHDRHRRADDGLLKHGRRIRAAAALLRSVARIPETRAVIDAVGSALRTAQPRKVVCLSTIGAQATQVNLLTQLTMIEQAFGDLPMPVAFLRPAWFLENAAWDVATARDTGVIHSFCSRSTARCRWLPPKTSAARRRPCCRTNGRARASSNSKDRGASARTTALRSPACSAPVKPRPSPRHMGRPVRSAADALPEPRMRMLDGFNEGWIDFASAPADVLKGNLDADAVLRTLVTRAA